MKDGFRDVVQQSLLKANDLCINLYPFRLDELDQLNQVFKLNFPVDDQDMVLYDFPIFAFRIILDISRTVDDVGFLEIVFLGVVAILVIVKVIDFSVSFWSLGFDDIACIKMLYSRLSLFLDGLNLRGLFALDRLLFNVLFLQMRNILAFHPRYHSLARFLPLAL
jgi:hypothetical protein